ncbi:MAG TPA: hypothetical protein VFK41_04670 [Nocardioidaceae bacterium]|nr:hypothetical protein [Nocardioidaceae bacterium]
MADREIDPVIVDYVEHVANRFGAQGLEELITLAQEHLVVARKALEELAHLDE